VRCTIEERKYDGRSSSLKSICQLIIAVNIANLRQSIRRRFMIKDALK
jgi:hypothetical protein